MGRKYPKQFVAYFHFVGWDCISFGFHVCFGKPNVEVHLPFGFIRSGWMDYLPGAERTRFGLSLPSKG